MSFIDSINTFINCFKYDAVNPYSHVYDTIEDIHNNYNYLENFYNNKDPDLSIIKFIKEERPHTCFTGGIVGMSRDSIILVSGWDERMRGRGFEDYSFTSKIKLFLDSLITFDNKAIHLYHPWEVNSTREINEKLNDEYCGYNVDDYLKCITYTNKYFGNVDKYKNDIVVEFNDNLVDPTILENQYKKAKIKYNELLYIISRKHLVDKEKFIYYNLCELHDCLHECNENDNICYESGNFLHESGYIGNI